MGKHSLAAISLGKTLKHGAGSTSWGCLQSQGLGADFILSLKLQVAYDLGGEGKDTRCLSLLVKTTVPIPRWNTTEEPPALHACLCVHVCPCTEARDNLGCHYSSSIHPPCLQRQSLPLAWNSPSKLEWLASQRNRLV